jgi:lipid A 4'-phosphatase
MPGKPFNNIFMRWWMPLLLMGLITPFTPWLDLTVSRHFFQNGFQSNALFDVLYKEGILPAWITVGGALVVLVGSFWIRAWKAYRRGAGVLILSLAIGSGLIAHLIFKDHWGRPRPKQVIEFGGHQPFRPYYEANLFHQTEPSKSFPCGHCTMGFYFFALAIVAQLECSKKIYITGMTLAWGLGLLLGLARIAQGGHFFSDVLAAGLIMWYTPLVLTTLFYQEPISK